jgi:hypothetical protein
MQNTVNVEKSGVTALKAINVAKVITIICLIAFAVVFGVPDWRQVIYMCLHVSYWNSCYFQRDKKYLMSQLG